MVFKINTIMLSEHTQQNKICNYNFKITDNLNKTLKLICCYILFSPVDVKNIFSKT